jgi:hypothetical protein
MKNLKRSLGAGLLLASTFMVPAVAQDRGEGSELAQATGSAADLRVSPRIGASFTTSGPGYDEPFFSIEGFVPLSQNSGSTLTFLEGKALILTNSTVGGNLVLGQRFYSASQNHIIGGYLAYDFRDTGNNFFHQIGAGFERLGDDWDFRINGYLPLGERRREVSETLTNPRFQQNFLLLDREEEFEASAAGFDIEAGGRLLALGDGDLRGYAGVYYYDTEGDDGFGVRGRLEARPLDNLKLGLLIQNDPLFDTQVVFNIGVNFPGSRSRGAEPSSVIARMGETVGRDATITVDEQSESSTVTATNPATNEPYRFQHVSLELGNSDGTFESPFGTVEEALRIAQPNEIVYVRASTDPGIPPFAIPDGVSVLSTGPAQFIDTAEVDSVLLPFSGTGLLPTINGAVTMGNNTVLSGFRVISPTNGIEGSGIGNVVIRDNVISGTTGSGIALNPVAGGIEITNNAIASNNGTGITVGLLDESLVDLTVEGNVLSNVVDGVLIGAIDTVQGITEVVDNTINNLGGIGIGVEVGENSLLDLDIGNNAIDGNTDGTGIYVGLSELAQVNLSIDTNTITDVVDGIVIGASNTVQNTTDIVDNAISNFGGIGVGIEVGDNSVLNLDIGNNTLNGGTDSLGLLVGVLDQAQVELNVDSNTISNVVSGVLVGTSETGQGIIEIANNTINNLDGIAVGAELAGNSILDLSIDSNAINGLGGTGISVDVLDESQVDLSVNTNTISNVVDGVIVGTSGTAMGTADVVNNTVNSLGGLGVSIELAGDSILDFTGSNNAIDNAGSGIDVSLAGNSILDLNLGENTINNSEIGISVEALDQSLVAATIDGNSLSGVVDGISLNSSGTSQIVAAVTENEITDSLGGVGISVNGAGSSLIEVGIGSNTIDNTYETGVIVEASELAQLDVALSDNSLANLDANASGMSIVDLMVGGNTLANLEVNVLEQAELDLIVSDNSLTNLTTNLSGNSLVDLMIGGNTLANLEVNASDTAQVDLSIGENAATNLDVNALGTPLVNVTVDENLATDLNVDNDLVNVTVGDTPPLPPITVDPVVDAPVVVPDVDITVPDVEVNPPGSDDGSLIDVGVGDDSGGDGSLIDVGVGDDSGGDGSLIDVGVGDDSGGLL